MSMLDLGQPLRKSKDMLPQGLKGTGREMYSPNFHSAGFKVLHSVQPCMNLANIHLHSWANIHSAVGLPLSLLHQNAQQLLKYGPPSSNELPVLECIINQDDTIVHIVTESLLPCVFLSATVCCIVVKTGPKYSSALKTILNSSHEKGANRITTSSNDTLGCLDNRSAIWLVFPFLYSTTKLNCWRQSIHLKWWVCHSFACLPCMTACTTAYYSLS